MEKSNIMRIGANVSTSSNQVPAGSQNRMSVSPSGPVTRSTTLHPPAAPPVAVTPVPIDPMLDSFQVADMLGISFDLVKKWRQRNTGPEFVRYPDGAIRYRLSALLKFIEDNTVKPSNRIPKGFNARTRRTRAIRKSGLPQVQ